MKKIFSILSLACLLFVSCSNDDSHSPSKKIVGTWQEIDGQNNNIIWTFESSGKFSYENPNDIGRYENCNGTAEGVWSLSDDGTILMIKLSRNNSQKIGAVFEDTHEILSLSETQMSFMTISGYTVGDTYMFKKVNKKEEVVEPANIKYGVYIPTNNYYEIIVREQEILLEAKRLFETITYRKSKKLDISQQLKTLNALCGENLDKQIYYGNVDVLVVSANEVRMGKVDVYSNYSGNKTIIDSGMSSDIVKYNVLMDKVGGVHRLQLVENELQSYTYTANGSQIKVSEGTKWNCNTETNKYTKVGTSIEYTTCLFVD